jgi:predicted methyltransferase
LVGARGRVHQGWATKKKSLLTSPRGGGTSATGSACSGRGNARRRIAEPTDDEDIEKREIQAAGFRLVDEGTFLRNSADPHDMPVFNPKIPIDIYVLKFQKP